MVRRRILRAAPVIAALLFSLLGCSQPQDTEQSADASPSPEVSQSPEVDAGHLPTVTLDELFDAYPSALVTGTLSAIESDATVYFIIEADDQRFGLVFPPGFTAIPGDPIELAGPDGEIIAKAGDTTSFGGGEYPLGRRLWESGPEIDEPWLVSPESARSRND